MFRPAKMKRVDLLVLERDVRRVLTALGRLGVLHLVRTQPEHGQMKTVVEETGATPSIAQCEQLTSLLGSVCEKLGLHELPEPASRQESHESLAEIESYLANLATKVDEHIARREELRVEAEQIQNELLRLDALRMVPIPIKRLRESPFLHFAIGTMRVSDIRRLESELRDNIILAQSDTGEERRPVIAITSRKGRFALESLLEKHHFERKESEGKDSDAPARVVEALEGRLAEIKRQQERISEELHRLSQQEASRLAAVARRLRLERALNEAEANFGRTSSTCHIGGWIPEDYVREVSERMLEVTNGRMVLKVRDFDAHSEDISEVPVMLKHHPLVRPFELLVRGFGFPQYDEIEPTLFVALSFLVMFGLMFGDVGQGLLLALAGLLVNRLARKPQLRDGGVIICAAGLSATIFGFLYGSVFGLEGERSPIRPLWLDPMADKTGIVRLLGLTIGFGTLLISVGVILNIVNRLRARDYLRGVLDRFGIVGIMFYWGTLGLGLKALLLGGRSLRPWEIALFIIMPLAILFLKEPIYNLVTRRGRLTEHGLFVALTEACVEMIELISSYMANTISFARVGAFALGHAGLCMAIFGLEEAVRLLPLGVVWGWLVLILGNALILTLECMIVFIQCVRLEYYEFFSKFYEGLGKGYRPFQIP